MPIDYSKYPPNWKSEIRPAILRRAGNVCERCGVRNGAIGYRDKNGTFHAVHAWDESVKAKHRLFRIVLTVAHLNHNISDNRPENLAALCQKCHLTHDQEQHKATRQKNRFRDQPGILFMKRC